MSSSQLRITFFISELAAGGAPQQLVHLASGLKHAGVSPEIVMWWDNLHPPYGDVLADAGVPVRSLHLPRLSFDLRLFSRLPVELRRTKPHIVQSFLFYENILARVFRPLHRAPVLISSVRNVYEGGHWRSVAYYLTDPLVNVTTQNSRAGAERYIRNKAVPAHKMRVIPNIIDTERFVPNCEVRTRTRWKLGVESRFVWLSASRLEPAKSPAQIVSAFARICKQRSDVVLLMAGDGSLRGALEAQVDDLQIRERVRLLGTRTDLPELMNAADAFITTSVWEGTSNSALEASAVALPVLATDVGGMRDVVQDSITGYIVPPNDLESVITCMRTIMNLSADQRQQMGLAGREHTVARFSEKNSVKQWLELYSELLAKKRIEV